MGKQVMFYMAKSDEDRFLDYLRTTGDVAIIPQTSREELREEFRDFSETEGRPLGESSHLWNRSISPRPVVKHYPQQGYYWLDFLQSEVVNVMRSKMTDQGLSMGRLHVEDKIRGTQGNMRQKNERFEAWVSDLFRWIKQQSVRVIDGAYVLPEADALIQGGTQVTGHKF
jgi:hypothetical protein